MGVSKSQTSVESRYMYDFLALSYFLRKEGLLSRDGYRTLATS